ncbi:MAG: lysozyme [Hyphomonadaceae bacterium]
MGYRSISPMGLAQIEAHEGFRAEAVRLADGRFVVGFGHVCLEAPAKPVTRQEAAALLAADLEPVERAVNELVKVPLQQSPYDALVSFAFSVGVEAFAKSDVLRRMNANEPVAAACAMDAWRKSGVAGEAEVYEILVRRRSAEKALLLAGQQGAPSAWLKPQIDHACAILGAPANFGALPALVSADAPVAANDDVAVVAPAVMAMPAPANDCAPVPAERRIQLTAPKAAPSPSRAASFFEAFASRVPPQVAFVALTVAGLALVLSSAIAFYNAAPHEADLTASLAIAAPGVVAAAAGLFFLTRRARAAFA